MTLARGVYEERKVWVAGNGGHMGGNEGSQNLSLEGRGGIRTWEDLLGRESCVNKGTWAEESPTLKGIAKTPRKVGGAQAWLSQMVGGGVWVDSARESPHLCLSSNGFRILPPSGNQRHSVPRVWT